MSPNCARMSAATLIVSISLALPAAASSPNIDQSQLRCDRQGINPTRSTGGLKGIVSASRSFDIAARIDGTVKRITFRAGQYVKKGELLVEFIQDVAEQDVRLAEAAYSRASLQLLVAERDVRTYEQLAQSNATSRNRLFDIKMRYEIAKVDVIQADATLARSKAILERFRLYAPAGGNMTAPRAHEGTYLEAKLRDGSIARLMQLDTVRIAFEVPMAWATGWLQHSEADRQVITTGIPVRLYLPDGAVYKQLGVIEASAFEANTETGMANVTALVPNPDHILLPGMSVTTEVCDKGR